MWFSHFHIDHPGIPTTRIYWPYLASALLMTLIIFLVKKKPGQKFSLKNFIQFSFPAHIYKNRSAILDYIYFITNQLVFGLLFVPFIVSSAFIARYTYQFLLEGLGSPAIQFSPHLWMNLGMTLFAALMGDLARFVGHYCNHRIPFLWNFHKVHHSAEVLTPITVYRAHPLELFINGNLIALGTGLTFGLFNYFALSPLGLVTILKLNVVIFAFNILGSNLRHSHVWISYPAFLSRILISPAQHQIHHSLDRRHFNKNYGSIFAIWDWLFKSLYIPKEVEQFDIGLRNQEHQEFSGLLRLYLLPLKKNFSWLFKKNSPKPKAQAASNL